MKFTSGQEEVLGDESFRLLVSASAGSGKTATIIEKIFEMVYKGKANLEDLLVVTFTDAASMEMKTRLKDRFRKACLEDSHFRGELEKISTCDISTLHSFCAKMIRKYFYFLNLKPNFVVLDDSNSEFLKIKALSKVLKDYAKNEDADFNTLSLSFEGGRSLDNLKSQILKFYDFLHAIDDREDFLKNIGMSCYEEDFSLNSACKFLNKYICGSSKLLIRELEKILKERLSDEDSFHTLITESIETLKTVNIQNDIMQNEKAILSLNFPRVNPIKDGANVSMLYDFKKHLWALKDLLLDGDPLSIKEDLLCAKNIVKKFCEVEDRFEIAYRALKLSRNGLDFSDLESYFLLLLSKDTDLMPYKYIFVDEYQDINCVQEKILSKLSKVSSMVMIGDVKQSIYGFRNSTPEIFIKKLQKYLPKGTERVINLNENFRSNPVILAFVNKIFEKCMSVEFGGVDYEKNKLVSNITYDKVNDFPEVEVNVIEKDEDTSDDEEDTYKYKGIYSIEEDKNDYVSRLTKYRKEAMIVGDRILNLVDKNYYDAKKKAKTKISFSDIAILCRTNDFLKEVAKVLMEYHIPISVDLVDNIYQNQDVEVLLSFLKLLNNLHDDKALSIFLTSYFMKFSFDELSKIRMAFPDEHFFYKAFKNFSDLRTFQKEEKALHAKVKNFYAFTEEFRSHLLYDSIYDILNILCSKFGYFDYILSLPGGTNRLKAVKDFINSFNGTDYNFDLVSYLDFVKNYAHESRFKASFPVTTTNVVKLGTIHSSKGLEYPIVFVVGCGQSFSRQLFMDEVIFDKDMGIGMHTFDIEKFEKRENFARVGITAYKHKREREEELRLLYVALTRAKNHLIVVGSYDLSKVKRIRNSFDSEIANNYMTWILSILSAASLKKLISDKSCTEKLDIGQVKFNAYGKNDFKKPIYSSREFKFKDIDKNMYDALKKNLEFKFKKEPNIAFKSSVSTLLLEHGEDTESYNYSPKILSIFEPTVTNISKAKLGIYYHLIMESIDFNSPFNKEVFDSIVGKLNIEEKYMGKIDYEKIRKCVETIRSLGGKRYRKEMPFLAYIPYNKIFGGSLSCKILIRGVVDLLVASEDKIYLIDYKINRTASSDALINKYKVQLKLYKICLEEALNKRFDALYIYSFHFGKLLPVILDN